MITILNRTKKCGICGKIGEGLLFFNNRLDRLPPIFLCAPCLEKVRAAAEMYKGESGNGEKENAENGNGEKENGEKENGEKEAKKETEKELSADADKPKTKRKEKRE